MDRSEIIALIQRMQIARLAIWEAEDFYRNGGMTMTEEAEAMRKKRIDEASDAITEMMAVMASDFGIEEIEYLNATAE